MEKSLKSNSSNSRNIYEEQFKTTDMIEDDACCSIINN